MNSTQLTKWKVKQEQNARDIVSSISEVGPSCISQCYPEFDLSGTCTTSLDPQVPVWAMLPFFEKVILGIMPYFKNEDKFQEWYGLSVRQVLEMHEQGRLAIRVLNPSARSTTPRFLNDFFTGEFPSTTRDEVFDENVLGLEAKTDIERRFDSITADFRPEDTLDGFQDAIRARRVSRTAYMQCHAVGHPDAASQFEYLWRQDHMTALRWLNLSRLFLVGPVHYSLGGIHSIASNVPGIRPGEGGSSHVFPAELGQILVDTLKLTRFSDRPGDSVLEASLELYPGFDDARAALAALKEAVDKSKPEKIVSSAEQLSSMIQGARRKERRWLRSIRAVAAVGFGTATGLLDIGVGLLAGLGFELSTSTYSEKVDSGIKKVGQKLGAGHPKHIALLLDLEDSVRAHFEQT